MDDRLSIIQVRILADRESGARRSLIDHTSLFAGEDALVAQAFADAYESSGADSPAASSQDSIGHYRILKELSRRRPVHPRSAHTQSRLRLRAPSDALAKLPEAERARWTTLWSDIDALLSSLDRKPESRAPGK